MHKVLALLIVGMSVSVVGGAAFGSEPGKDSVDHEKFPPAAVSRAETANTNTIAGPSTPLSVWTESHYDNYDSGRKN